MYGRRAPCSSRLDDPPTTTHPFNPLPRRCQRGEQRQALALACESMVLTGRADTQATLNERHLHHELLCG